MCTPRIDAQTWFAHRERKSRQALQASTDELRMLANSMAQLVWVTRVSGDAEHVNNRWYEYTGQIRPAPQEIAAGSRRNWIAARPMPTI